MHFKGTPQLLGYLGLIPFFALTALAWTHKYHDISVQVLAVYAAIILTFIGAVHWGIALSNNDKQQNSIRYVYSVIPSIIAWLLVSMYSHFTLPLLMVSFFMCFILERGFFFADLPEWYGLLRRNLTFFVTLLLFIASLSSLVV